MMKNKDMLAECQDHDICSKKNAMSPLASCFLYLSPKQSALLSTVLGLLLIEGLDLDQQNSLGNFIVSVGTAILTAAAQGELIESMGKKDDPNGSKKNDPIRLQIEILKKQISALEQALDQAGD